MRSTKKTRLFSLGRKWVFTLALFLLVFAAASIIKVQAVSNVTGYLWGGSEDANLGGLYDERCSSTSTTCGDGNETGVGEIRMSGTIQDGSGNKYGVNIPDSGNLSGHAWSENLGYLSFNEGELSDCPSKAVDPNSCRAWRDGNTLKGWARFMEFKIHAAQAGGWGGWVSLSNLSPGAGKLPYGVVIEGDSFKKCNGKTGENCAWSGENLGTGGNIADGLGWIDFSEANMCIPEPGHCGPALGQDLCVGDTPLLANLCSTDSVLDGSLVPTAGGYTWHCKNTGPCPGEIEECVKLFTTPEIGKCGTDDGVNFCGKGAPTNLCDLGTESPLTEEYSEYTWKCGSNICGGSVVDCSAPGLHCGWIETNP